MQTHNTLEKGETKMLGSEHGYNRAMLNEMALWSITEEEIQTLFKEYGGEYGYMLVNGS